MSIDGWTPLLKATYKQYHETMKKLLEQGANPSHRQSFTQNTALHIASDNGDLEAVTILVRDGRCDLEAQNKEKETPLSIAQKHLSMMSMMSQDDPTYQHFADIYSYLKGVWDEREKKAQQAKDELVK